MAEQTLFQRQKGIALQAMYRSVERMNEHVLQGNYDGMIGERILQVHLRRDFENLQQREASEFGRVA